MVPNDGASLIDEATPIPREEASVGYFVYISPRINSVAHRWPL